MNTGWEWQKDENGGYMISATGKRILRPQSQMPLTLTNNAAGVLCETYVLDEVDDGAGGDSEVASTSAVHLNHYASAVLRYDDTKFCEPERARAGFYRDEEYPTLKIDLEQAYFNGNAGDAFRWAPGTPSLDLNVSKMMRFRLTLTNLSKEQMDTLGIYGRNPDSCSNPDLSILLPFIEGFGAAGTMTPSDFAYVPYGDTLSSSHPLNENYTSTAVVEKVETTLPTGQVITQNKVVEYAQNLDDTKPMWTYHVENRDPFFKTEEVVDVPEITLIQPQVGGNLTVVDKLGDVATGYDRKFMDWRFTGHPDETGEVTRGALRMGQAVVIEFMMPVRDDANSSIPTELLNTTGYGYKKGNYEPYIPEVQGADKTSFVLDTRDTNLDGNTNQMMLALQLAAVGFSSNITQDQSNFVTSQISTLYTRNINGPAAVPEGSDYTYFLQADNPGANMSVAQNYVRTTFLNVLPHTDDTKVYNGTKAAPQKRESTWNGWIKDLDSIKLTRFDPGDPLYPKGRELTAAEAQVWAGPYEWRDGKLVCKAETDLPHLWAQGTSSAKMKWINERRHDPALLRQDGFVPLSELKSYVAAHPDEAEVLQKGLRAFWTQVDDDEMFLPCQGYIRLSYQMHAPLNLPKYLGSTKGDATFDLNLDAKPGENEGSNPDLSKRLAQVTQWNTFVQRINGAGKTDAHDASARALELKTSGAFIDAPEGRGYLGDYVWFDFNWDGLQNDTDGPVVKDDLGRQTTYHRASNGRFLLSTAKTFDAETGAWKGAYTAADGTLTETRALFRDLDYDGTPDDPGVNGVTVELLNEYGLAVNRDGQVVREIKDAAGAGQDRWVQCDAKTGEPLRNSGGGYVNADAGGPVSFTTESDYYNNKGYWILSNLKPGRYKLRYVFPRAYANYSITTKSIGPDKDGDGVADNPLEITRVADDPATPEDETAMYAVTQNAIEVKGIKGTGVDKTYDEAYFKAHEDAFMNPDGAHRAYDAEATSYDVGIARPVEFTGVAFRDDKLADGTDLEPDFIDGLLDHQSDPSQP